MEIELVTPPLAPEMIRAQMLSLVERFRTMGIRDLVVSFGWACELPLKELWKEQTMPLADFSDFIDAAISTGVWKIGNGDVWVKDSDRKFELLFCHESDVHFKSESGMFLDEVRNEWRRQFAIIYEKAADESNWRLNDQAL